MSGVPAWQAAADRSQPVASGGRGLPSRASRVSSLRVGSFLATALLLLAPAISPAWQVEIRGTRDGDFDFAHAAVVDPSGDVIAAGEVTNRKVFGRPNPDFAVVKISGSSGAILWRTEIDNTRSGDTAWDLALDGAQNVIAVGRFWFLEEDNVNSSMGVVKLSGSTGEELWRAAVDGAQGQFDVDYAIATALDPLGDVVITGVLENRPGLLDFAVVKLSGLNGSEIWRRELVGSANDHNIGHAVAVDAAGDVVAVGALTNVGGADGRQSDFAVVKLSGSTGATLWRVEIDGGAELHDGADSVVIDPAGDVVVGGELDPGTGDHLTVLKLAGATGAELWRAEFPGTGFPGGSRGVAVNSSGDLIVGGGRFTILKLSGPTGAEIWSTSLAPGVVIAVAFDSVGDAVAAGGLSGEFAMAKLSGATGSEIWRSAVPGAGGRAVAVAVAAEGDVSAAGGRAFGALTGTDFAVVQARGSDGVVTPTLVSGRRIRLVDPDAVPGFAPRFPALGVAWSDPSIVAPVLGGPSDPTLSGAVLRVVNPSTSEEMVIDLPAALWTVKGNPLRPSGYLYRDPTFGSCKSVVLSRRRFRAKCKGDAVDFTLDEPSQGTLAVRLELGGDRVYCASFGGDVEERPGFFKALDAPVPSECPVP